jgi:lipoprotein NlpI
MALGELARAIGDLDQALRLRPELAEGYFRRGYARFAKGDFDAAAADFAKAQEILPASAFAALWRHMADARAGRAGRSDLTNAAARLNVAAWPGPAIKLFLGTATQDQVLAGAKDDDQRRSREQLCQAYFVLGQNALLRNDRATAARMLTAALNTGTFGRIEFIIAQQELGRLPRP